MPCGFANLSTVKARIRCLSGLVVLFSCLSAIFSNASDALSATQQGWIFKRNNGLGPETIYATSEAVLISYPSTGLNVLCKSPTWEIVWYNTKHRIWYHESLTHYRTRKQMPAKEKQLSQSGRHATTYAEHDAIEFSDPVKDPEDEPRLPSSWRSEKTHLVETQYFFSKPLSLSKEAMMFLDSFFGVPASGGVPLGCQVLNSDKSIQRLWITNSFEKSAIDSSLFKPPSGYKLAPDASELGGAKAAYTAEMEDMLNGLGVGKPFGRH